MPTCNLSEFVLKQQLGTFIFQNNINFLLHIIINRITVPLLLLLVVEFDANNYSILIYNIFSFSHLQDVPLLMLMRFLLAVELLLDVYTTNSIHNRRKMKNGEKKFKFHTSDIESPSILKWKLIK